MPVWAQDAIASTQATVTFLDLVLEVAHYFGWTTEDVLQMPVRRFWRTVDHITQRRQALAQAAKDNPLAALALLLGR